MADKNAPKALREEAEPIMVGVLFLLMCASAVLFVIAIALFLFGMVHAAIGVAVIAGLIFGLERWMGRRFFGQTT